jgi:hypothetical protein
VIEFKGWPKTPRLFRDSVITEKIDGTNACVVVQPDAVDYPTGTTLVVNTNLGEPNWWVSAQSRQRVITSASDNYGFAAWVYANAASLVDLLGPGYHYGEWWGKGIQRGYGLDEKRFSLFNVSRYEDTDLTSVPGLGVVPVLQRCTFNTAVVLDVAEALAWSGSKAAPGFMAPEGVVVYHTASSQLFKYLIEADNRPKTLSQKDLVLAA